MTTHITSVRSSIVLSHDMIVYLFDSQSSNVASSLMGLVPLSAGISGGRRCFELPPTVSGSGVAGEVVTLFTAAWYSSTVAHISTVSRYSSYVLASHVLFSCVDNELTSHGIWAGLEPITTFPGAKSHPVLKDASPL